MNYICGLAGCNALDLITLLRVLKVMRHNVCINYIVPTWYLHWIRVIPLKNVLMFCMI